MGKKAKNPISALELMILCGGLGTRFRPVIGERQKVVAHVSGRPFLGALIDYFIENGFRRFVLATGYGKEEVRKYVTEAYKKHSDASFIFSEEDEPLRTGGAIKQALVHVNNDHFFVANGDTFCDVDFEKFFNFHLNSGAVSSVALARSEREDGGNVVLEDRGRIVSFNEKENKAPTSYINAGIYVMHKPSVLEFMPGESKFSIELDVFPKIVAGGKCFGFVTGRGMLDIGTPDRFKDAHNFLVERPI